MSKKDDDSFTEKFNMRWVVGITLWTFLLAIIFSIIAENLVVNLSIILSFIILLLIIIVGIIFDIIGIAVAAAEESPFHAMAANKIDEAKVAIKLVRNAGQVSNFCNDVIGDISGIVSGGVGTTLIYKIINVYGFKNGTLLTIILTALIASLTVGGKAMGKTIALLYYEKIIFKIAKMFNFIEISFGIDFFPNKKRTYKANR